MVWSCSKIISHIITNTITSLSPSVVLIWLYSMTRFEKDGKWILKVVILKVAVGKSSFRLAPCRSRIFIFLGDGDGIHQPFGIETVFVVYSGCLVVSWKSKLFFSDWFMFWLQRQPTQCSIHIKGWEMLLFAYETIFLFFLFYKKCVDLDMFSFPLSSFTFSWDKAKLFMSSSSLSLPIQIDFFKI